MKRYGGYQTRSKTKRTRLLLEEQPRCPITLEPFTADTIVFTHNNVKFDALRMRDYLLSAPGSTNPVNRTVLTDEDIDRLNAVCNTEKAKTASCVLKGQAAQTARTQQQEQESNLIFLENEAQMSLTRLSQEWDEYDDFFHNAVSIFRNQLCEIKNDVLSCTNGTAHWNAIIDRLKIFMNDNLRVPDHAKSPMQASFSYLLRPQSVPDVPSLTFTSFNPMFYPQTHTNTSNSVSESDSESETESDSQSRTSRSTARAGVVPPPQHGTLPIYSLVSPLISGSNLSPGIYSFNSNTNPQSWFRIPYLSQP
jgi:hypothetical protein